MDSRNMVCRILSVSYRLSAPLSAGAASGLQHHEQHRAGTTDTWPAGDQGCLVRDPLKKSSQPDFSVFLALLRRAEKDKRGGDGFPDSPKPVCSRKYQDHPTILQ